MRKIKEFIKSTCISSRILFAVWFFFVLFIKSAEQSKMLTMFEMGVVFLLPAIMTELRRNPVFRIIISSVSIYLKIQKLQVGF